MTSPKRVAVVGGAGAFGRNLVQGLLATTDCHVIICGRSRARAQDFVETLAAGQARVSVAAFDRERATAADIAALGAFCVADAAGPFQAQAPAFARAVIDTGAHYVDLADARDFVASFGQLDELAQQRGVLAVTGASSTPALSHAVIDEVTRGWTRIDEVEIAISPGNRAPLGLAVIKSILSYVGRPVRVLRHGRWTEAPGWGLTVRRKLSDVGGRLLSLCETPDLDLVPARFPSVRTAIFRAGLELSFLHLAIWALSLPVRAGWLRSLAPLAEPLRDAAALFRPLGGDCGGMLVDVSGIYADGSRLHVTWTLIAEAGDGPQIPALPALCVIHGLLDGTLHRRGAVVCVGLVELGAIERQFKRFAIHTSRETQTLETAPLFQRALAAFERMPDAVRRAHAPDPASDLEGEVDIEGAETWLGRVVARLFRFPESGRSVPASVTIEREGDGEVWIRRFGETTFASHLSAGGSADRLHERFGPLTFDLDARASEAGFDLAIRGAKFFGMPLPRALLPNTAARAAVDERGRYRFDVLITLPVVGRLVRYEGWLAPISAPSP